MPATARISITAGISIILSLFPQVTQAYGIPCPSVVDRVLDSDSIVLGRTIRIERIETRPTLFAIIYEFRIDRVLKGSLHKVGDVFHYRDEPDMHRAILEAPLPFPDEAAHFAFFRRGAEAWCPISVNEINIENMERLIAVVADPLAHLESDREDDVCVILASIGRMSSKLDPNADDRSRVTAYLRKQAATGSPHVSTRAMHMLANLDPSPPDAFDDFTQALESTDPPQLIAGAIGLKRVKDKRAIPLLIARLQEFRRNGEAARNQDLEVDAPEGSVCALTITHSGHPFRRMPESELISSIMSFDDPRVTEFALVEVDGPASRAVMTKIADTMNEQTVEILLRKTWEGDSSGLTALCKSTDPRITVEARERKYDHPHAPYLLACRGDAESKEFMLRLLRQGNGLGAKWVAQTRDLDAKSDLIRGSVRAGAPGGDRYYFLNEAGCALGRLRAFELLSTYSDTTLDINELSIVGMMLYGLADRSVGDFSDCPGTNLWNCLRTALHDMAKRENWQQEHRDLADHWLTVFERGPKIPNYKDVYHPWVPPLGLSDMPDPLDENAARTYFESDLASCRTALRHANSGERYKIMQVANHAKVAVLDGELALALLADADSLVRSQAFWAVSADRPALTFAEVEKWAFTPDGDISSMALNYIRRHPKPEFRPIVVNLLKDGWHLFNKLLFEAIIKTEATEAADLLRPYLENEHITLRTNAAVTLVHLHDAAGAKALPDLLRKAQGSGQLLGNEFTQTALQMIQADPASNVGGE